MIIDVRFGLVDLGGHQTTRAHRIFDQLHSEKTLDWDDGEGLDSLSLPGAGQRTAILVRAVRWWQPLSLTPERTPHDR